MVICPDCGKDVEKSKFCKNCGAYIENIEDPINNTPQTGAVIPIESKKKFKYCFNCGYELGGDFNFCPNCGYNLNPVAASGKKSLKSDENKNTLLAIILSVLLPGLGQIYLGLDHKGAIFLIAYVVSAILILLIIGFLLVIVIWIWALVDTIQSVNALNRGEEVIDKLL